jgi:hypothetical protein
MEMCHSNTRLSIYGMGDTTAFVIIGDAPLASHASIYLHNRRRTSLFCQRSGHVSDINLTVTCRKVDHHLFTLH